MGEEGALLDMLVVDEQQAGHNVRGDQVRVMEHLAQQARYLLQGLQCGQCCGAEIMLRIQGRSLNDLFNKYLSTNRRLPACIKTYFYQCCAAGVGAGAGGAQSI